jgi:PAS domain S-box-containing protein
VGEGVIIPDVQDDPRWFSGVDQKTSFITKAIACAPIRYHGEVIGVLEALNPLAGIFGPDALPVLSGIGGLAGTAIRHAELFERLQAAHQRFRELFEDSIDPIVITDWNGRILEANRQACAITSVDRDTLYGTGLERFQFVDHSELGARFEKLRSGETISFETNLRSESGREVPVQVYARSVLIEGVSYLQWILHDLTERKNLDNLRNDLISMIYHDLRSPLANIVSSLDVMEAMVPKDSDPAVKSLLNIAIRSTERIQRLTDSLLDIRRLEAGQPIGNTQMIKPSELAKEAVEIVLPVMENKNQEVSVLVPEELPSVWVDPDMIRRVITNLLEIGVKYTPTGSKIYLGARQEGNMVQMWVQDTGPGIPPDERERIFDKFTRLHGRGGPKGLGLGLAFCRLAVEAHGGQIWVEDGPESGACFKFTLPTSADQA